MCIYSIESSIYDLYALNKKKSDVMFHIATCSSILIFKVLDNKFYCSFPFLSVHTGFLHEKQLKRLLMKDVSNQIKALSRPPLS